MDKTQLLARRLPTGTVPIPGVGTVTVRGLTRAEMLAAGRDNPQERSIAEMERIMLATAMVDPVMTQEEVGQWQANSPADEISAVVAEINRLSGVGQGADKAAYKSVREQP